MPHRHEDPTVWIGYSDFLTTLAVLFFVLFVAIAAKNRTGSAQVVGQVRDMATGTALSDCLVQLGEGQQDRTDVEGVAEFELARLSGPTKLNLRAECAGYGVADTILRVLPGDSAHVAIRLNADSTAGPIEIAVLPGDATFERNDFRLLPEAEDTIRQIGAAQMASLRPGEVIAVQGHTDDLPFPVSAGKDNWVLSSERAASAAKVLTDQVGIPGCQVVIMGFGPSRPLTAVEPNDPAAVREAKRARNRRIEFRKLRGAQIAGGECEQG